jgi:ATP/ADP translocase
VVGGRLGKSGGGVILQVVLMFGAIADNLPILLFCVALVVGAWIFSVFSLNKLYTAKLKEVGEETDQTSATSTATGSAKPQPA